MHTHTYANLEAKHTQHSQYTHIYIPNILMASSAVIIAKPLYTHSPTSCIRLFLVNVHKAPTTFKDTHTYTYTLTYTHATNSYAKRT
jgi:hypothetical protein